MPAVPVFLSALLVLALAACSRPYQVVEMPQYAADLYPTSQSRAGLTVAIDEIRRSDRSKRFFGSDLVAEGLMPVHVLVSNHGKQRVAVKPSDILLYRGKEVIDALPTELVVAKAREQHGYLASTTADEVQKFFENSTFRETVLLPGETYSGIVFFAPPAPKRFMDRWFRSLSTYGSGGPRIRVGATDLDSGERLLFGPFSVSLPQT